MEEATELFSIQRQQVRVLVARTNALVAAAATPATPSRTVRPSAPPPAAELAGALQQLDPWGEGILFLTLGAGLLAALMKRAQGPDPRATARPTTPASGSPRS